MAKKSFRCRVVTPTAALVDDQCTYASVPAWDGLLGIAPGRAPLLARLGMGPMRLDFADTEKGEGGSRVFLIEGGFLKMAGDELTVLAEKATPTENLVASEADAELKAAQNAAASGKDSLAQADKITKDRERARLKARLARNSGAI